MRVLRIIARLNVGGPARHVVWLTRNLSNDDFDSVLVAGSVPEGEEDMAYFARQNGVEPVFIPKMSRELSLRDFVSLGKIYRTISKYKPDIIHTHTAKAGTIGRIAAFGYKWLTPGTLAGRPRRVRVVHTFHGHVFHSYYGGMRTRIFLAIERLLARFATDRIIAISEQQFREICFKYRVGRPEQFSIVPLGMEISPHHDYQQNRIATRRELGIKADEIAIGFTGRLTEIKNLPLLMSVAELAGRQHSELRFVIVGDGSLRPELERLASPNVTFLGNQQDVARLLPAFDIIALTSKNEGTPLSLIEGMAAGIPFVSTAVGGVVDLAGDQEKSDGRVSICERGILIHDQNPQNFLSGLNALIGDPELQNRISVNAREFVRNHYSLERLTSDIERIYLELASESTS